MDLVDSHSYLDFPEEKSDVEGSETVVAFRVKLGETLTTIWITYLCYIALLINIKKKHATNNWIISPRVDQQYLFFRLLYAHTFLIDNFALVFC